MRTEKQIRAQLEKYRKALAKVTKRFHKYDNSEDMILMEDYFSKIEVLKWVVGECGSEE